MALKNGTKQQIKLLHNCGLILELPNRARRGESYSELEVDRMTPESVLDPPVLLSGSTSSTTSYGDGVISTGESWRTVLVKKKRSSVNYGTRVMYRPETCLPAADVVVAGNRRKGVPQRSPLY